MPTCHSTRAVAWPEGETSPCSRGHQPGGLSPGLAGGCKLHVPPGRAAGDPWPSSDHEDREGEGTDPSPLASGVLAAKVRSDLPGVEDEMEGSGQLVAGGRRGPSQGRGSMGRIGRSPALGAFLRGYVGDQGGKVSIESLLVLVVWKLYSED